MADLLRRLNAQTLAQFDREIQELRSEYSNLDDKGRSAFRHWLEQVCSVVDAQPTDPQITVLCRTNNLDVGEDGEVLYDGVVHLSPKAMLAAVLSWDSGQEFTPESFTQTM